MTDRDYFVLGGDLHRIRCCGSYYRLYESTKVRKNQMFGRSEGLCFSESTGLYGDHTGARVRVYMTSYTGTGGILISEREKDVASFSDE